MGSAAHASGRTREALTHLRRAEAQMGEGLWDTV